ncbi:hypothetical protein CCP3SC1AL1_320007 [Gammaproteobacteria bacterium]
MKQEQIDQIKLSDKEIDKGLFPELGSKKITIVNKQFQIVKKQNFVQRAISRIKKNNVTPVEKWEIEVTEMPVYYVKQFNNLLEPFYSILGGGNVNTENLASSLMDAKKIEKLENNLLEPAWHIVKYHANLTGIEIMKQDLDMNCSEAKLLEIIYAQLEVNKYTDFFTMLFQGLISTMAGMEMVQNKSQ